MLAFSTRAPAQFSYRADFSAQPFANISFFDGARSRILFHLSLRADTGLAVCNTRGAGPGDWGREIPRPAALDTDGVDVVVRIAPPRATVLLDGHEVFAFGPGLMRSRFPDLAQIAFVDYQGGLQPVTIDIAHDPADPQGGVLSLTPRLDLRGRLAQGPDPAALRLVLDGVPDDAPALITSPDPAGGTALRAGLSGRIWDQIAPQTEALIRLCEGQKTLSQTLVTRAGLLAQIEAALGSGDLRGDVGLATRIIEHVRYAGILDRLTPPARARLAELVDFLRLERFLRFDSVPDLAPDLTPVADPRAAALSDALAWVAQRLRTAQTPADLSALLAGMQAPPRDLPVFYAALAEPFCTREAFDQLYAHTPASAGMDRIAPGTDAWFNSGLLPYLLRSGRIDTLRAVLWQLAEETDRWIMQPPLAWTVRAALEDPALDEQDRDDIIYAFLAVLERRMWEYWRRSPCVQLADTAAALIGAGVRVPDYARPQLDSTVLRAFGLVPAFWDRIAARGITDLPPRLGAARDAFATLRDPEAAPDRLAAALALFDREGCPDATRMRRDLCGPAGLAGLDGAAPTVQALTVARRDVGEAAIRVMAFPEAGPAEPALARAAQTALPGLYTGIACAPHYDLQQRTSRRAADLLTRAQAGADPAADCAALLVDLATLCGPRAHWIGAGLGIGLLTGLLQAGADTAAGTLRDGLVAILDRAAPTRRKAAPAPDAATEQDAPRDRPLRGDLAHAPAVAMALRGLAQTGTDAAAQALAALGIPVRDLPHLPDPALPVTGAPVLAPANPLFDTLVTVFSCRPNLDTRVAQMRAGWLTRLQALGVPYVIVTGDGDGTLDGDVLRLDAPDDYEGLPQKTLATIRWVHDQTGFAHMLKIDDDCLLNPEEYFQSLSYRKFDYYGRILTRGIGQMDRAWHCAKSTSQRGRKELDKSPEPSTYCDGGSGYALSRTAMAAALQAAASPAGQALIQVSFMEDKMLGDLLALRAILPADEDYRITVRRREARGGIAVPRWLNGFDASRTARVKLVHLDDAGAQAGANRRLDSPALFPHKIWPSYQDVTLGEQTNALEMVTPPDRLKAARDAPVSVVACMRNEMFMLPHFLAHYRGLGVESFLIADNCSDDGTLEFLAEQPDVALFSVDTDYNLSHYGVAWQQALMANFRTNRWSLVADADELLVWEKDPRTPLADLLASPGFADADAARVFMLDLYPQGKLATADFAGAGPFAQAGFTDREPFLTNSFARGPYSDMPTWTSAVRHRLIPGSRHELFVAQKIALLKYAPWMRLSAGLHYVTGVRLAARELLFGHFKYNADFRRKAQAEVARRQHFNDAEEYRKYLALVSEGRDVIHDPDLSVPWTQSPFVAARLD